MRMRASPISWSPRLRLDEEEDRRIGDRNEACDDEAVPMKIGGQIFGRIPRKLFPVPLGLKISYSELPSNCLRLDDLQDLVSCSLRDGEDEVELLRNYQPEFKGYYMQMQVAKRSQTPLPSQDDRMLLDKTVADQVSIWKRNNGFSDKVVQLYLTMHVLVKHVLIIGLVMLLSVRRLGVFTSAVMMHAEKLIWIPPMKLLACKISGHCFYRLLSPSQKEPDYLQGGTTDGAEPFMGSC
ncbi:hypothetical protein SAY87_015340 [Trapa incisa]|uniref:Uncharacterized protein n=1 Tax=Trapa incisa TaxID=236973 RepID=A0AAN7H0Z3_9MYRT|nr:hypothetical protein SAY87_015340 [Trapa incisa]